MRKLFGTDGIRAVAGEYPLDRRTVAAIGTALAKFLGRAHPAAHVLLGRDTRESGTWMTAALAAGLTAGGARVTDAGIMTTPGVAYLARTSDYAAGIVLSASHNPWRDNGIKIFGHDGFKLPDEVELEIEREIFRELEGDPEPQTADAPLDESLRHAYVEWLASTVRLYDLSRIKVLVDCANGAATPVAHEVFRACGVSAVFIHDTPDGRNINEGCGALHPAVVARKLREENTISEERKRFTLGISFDGDADRALFSDENGTVVDGDGVLLACARHMQGEGSLRNDVVVATTMSNMGLEVALRESGIFMLRAPVGDKYVLAEMQRRGATLGGEQSGHVIFRDSDATTGDGLLTALRVMAVMAATGKPLSALVDGMKVFPQTIKNVRVRERRPLGEITEVEAAIREAEAELGERGRVVVRYSGTEALARVMVEAESEALMRRHADAIAGAIERHLGVS